MAAEASFVVEGADPASAIPFDLHPGSKVKVASLLKEFDAERIKYEKRPGVYIVMEEGPDGLSLAQFTPSSTVTIRITPSQGTTTSGIPSAGKASGSAAGTSSGVLERVERHLELIHRTLHVRRWGKYNPPKISGAASSTSIRTPVQHASGAGSLPTSSGASSSSAPSTRSTKSTRSNLSRDDNFRQHVATAYGWPADKCMVLDMQCMGDRGTIAGHLVPLEMAGEILPAVGLSINDPSFGIIWSSAIEAAYTAQAVALGVDDAEVVRLVVLDRNWAQAKLADYTRSTDSNHKAALGDTTFGQLQGRPLTFGTTGLKPRKRAILATGIDALRRAMVLGVLDPTANLQLLQKERISDYEVRDRLLDWINSLPAPPPVPAPAPVPAPPTVPALSSACAAPSAAALSVRPDGQAATSTAPCASARGVRYARGSGRGRGGH